MSDIDLHHLSAAYALDALDPHERAAFEAHYESCEVCRTDVLAFRATMTQVASSLATPPPPSLKDRVMADITVTRQLSPLVSGAAAPPPERRPSGHRTAWWLAAAAALVAVVVITAVAVSGRRDDSYSAELAHLMEQPDVQMVNLAAQDGHDGSFKVMWSPSMHRAALVGENLPAAPAGKAYELWLLTPDETMAMYVLDPADDGKVHRMFDAPADPSAWAVTMEPDQGVAVATGDVMFVAEVPPAA